MCTCIPTHTLSPGKLVVKPLPTHHWPHSVYACAQGLRNLVMDCPQLSPKGIQTPGTGPWTQSVNFLLWPQTNPTAKLLSPALSAGMDAEIGRVRRCYLHRLHPGPQLRQHKGPGSLHSRCPLFVPPPRPSTFTGRFRVPSGAAPCKFHPFSGLAPAILDFHAQHVIL